MLYKVDKMEEGKHNVTIQYVSPVYLAVMSVEQREPLWTQYYEDDNQAPIQKKEDIDKN